MSYDPTKHHRRSLRLSGYDYAGQGAYFVTICAYGRRCSLGEVAGGQVALSKCGSLVAECWHALPEHFTVGLDAFVVMPNHIHGILFITDRSEPRGGQSIRAGIPVKPELSANALPLRSWRGARAGSLAAIVQNFKSVSTRKINELQGVHAKFWQRNYYERVIRDDDELNAVRQYVLDNPQQWDSDEDNLASTTG